MGWEFPVGGSEGRRGGPGGGWGGGQLAGVQRPAGVIVGGGEGEGGCWEGRGKTVGAGVHFAARLSVNSSSASKRSVILTGWWFFFTPPFIPCQPPPFSAVIGSR